MQAPFDGRFKILAEEYPDLLLRLLGIVEAGTKPQFVDILRELQLDPVQVDHVYRVGGEAGERLVHLEAITSWSAKRTSRLALYRFLLQQKFKLPISSYVVLMAEKYAPKRMPARVVYRQPDGFRIEAPYQVIKLWEIDPAMAFAPGCEALLPWALLLKGGAAEFERASAEIESLIEHPERAPYPVPVMVSDLVTLAGLRYDKDVIRRRLAPLQEKLRTNTMLDLELFKDSWLYKDGVKEGRKEGRREGRAETLRLALNAKFPNLGPLPEIDQVSRIQALDKLLLAILSAKTEEDVRAAVQAALRVN